MIGREQGIEVGHLSGASNVHFFLQARGLPDTAEVSEAILGHAKKSERLLTEQEILDIVEEITGSQ
jgi:2-isopropylmalate synthase